MSAEQTAVAAEPVLTERRGNVLLITINRPEVRNAVNGAVAAGVAGALDELDGDDGLSVGVLTGTGGFFSAGMDLGAFVKGESPWFGDRGFAGIAQRASRKPLIAAIEGFARRRRHGDRARLRPDRRREGREDGHPRGQALARRRRRRAAAPAAADALPRGHGARAHRRSAAGRALRTSSALVNRLAEPGGGRRRRARARRAARRERPARADRLQAASCRSSSTGAARRCGRSRARSPGPVFASEDAKEGANAFKEKRDPVWKGR